MPDLSPEADLVAFDMRDPTPIIRVVRPCQELGEKESSSGILLIASTVIALVWANSTWSDTDHDFWHTKLGLDFIDQHDSIF